MWPDWVLNPGPLTYESDALSTMLRLVSAKAHLYSHTGKLKTNFNSTILLLNFQIPDNKILSKNFQKLLISPSYIILSLQRLKGKQCRSR